MKRSIAKLPHSEVRIEITYTAEEFAPYWDRAKERALSGVRIKGFRPGMAPKELAEAGIDHDNVLNEAVEEAVKSALNAVGGEERLRFLGSPKVEVKEHDKGLAFTIQAAVFPEVKLADYKKIARAVMQEKREVAVDDKEVEDSVAWLLKSRKAEMLTDEFAKSVGEFKDASDLKANIREGLLAEKTVHEADRKRAKVVEEIVKASKIDLPEVMIAHASDQMADELKATLQGGGANFDEYVQKHYTDMAGLRAHTRPRAEANVASNVVIHTLAESEHLEPTPEEVEEEVTKLAPQLKNSFDKQKIFEYSYGKLQTEKVYRFLESQL